jgi:hypothetical protein
MRLPKPWVRVIAADIVGSLLERELVNLEADRAAVDKAAEELMLDELMVEDRLNREIHELLKKHEAHIERNRLDYRELFELTKKKLVRERNIVL